MAGEVLSLLIVEDSKAHLGLWRREIAEFNDEKSWRHGISFEVVFAESGSEAIRLIETRSIDCGIVDLRLPDSTGGISSPDQGNKVLEEFINRFPAPVAIVSGHPAEATIKPGRALLTRFSKDAENYQRALDWLAGYGNLILDLKYVQAQIAKETARIFHVVLAPRWDATRATRPIDSEARKLTTVRQVVSQLAEQLSVPSGTNPRFAPEEFYIKPPLRERLHTGDLLQLDTGLHIILTPQCSIANEYPEYLIVAPCREKKDWNQILNGLKSVKEDKKKSAERELSKFTTQAHALRTHFIPPCDGDGPWLVEFDNIITIPCNIEALKQKRIKSLAPRFIPNLVQRFASYIGRIGQPDIDIEELAKQLAGKPENAS